MKSNPVIWVLSKEMREILRDRRVRTGAIITPIFVVIMMVMVFGIISSAIGKNSKQKITLVSTANPIAKVLTDDQKFKVSTVDNIDAGQQLIKDGKANLVVEIRDLPSKRSEVDLWFDPKEDQAEVAKAAVSVALQTYVAKRAANVLIAQKINPAELDVVSFKDMPVKVGEGAGAGSIIVGILPYLMVLFTFTGGFSIAADMVAGEKEKNTLETLLITPVARTQIVLGKFLAIALVCLTSSFSSILGLLLAANLHLPGSDIMFSGGFGLTGKACAVILACLLPLAAFFAGLLVTVSSYARNVREAQTYLSVVNLIILMPAILSQVIGFTDFAHSNLINFVPVLGTAMNIREAFQSKSSWFFAGESVITGAILAAIMLFIAVRLFVREQVLLRV